MSSDLGANRIFVLDALAHGLTLEALAGGFSFDAVAVSLNISKLELMAKLTHQAPLSNLLLVSMLKLEPLFNSTLIPPHLNNQIRQVVPTPAEPPVVASYNEPENDMYLEFLVLFWICLTFVISVAIMAMCTKMKMSVEGNWDRMERRLETERPKTDVERWCLRRKMARELEAKKREVGRLSMELAREMEKASMEQARG